MGRLAAAVLLVCLTASSIRQVIEEQKQQWEAPPIARRLRSSAA